MRRKKREEFECTDEAFDQIVFVCFGNINRSPFAAEALRTRVSGPRVLSAGLYEREGRPAGNEAMMAASMLGLNLEHHRSRNVANLNNEATLFVVFERFQAWELKLRFGRGTSVLPLAIFDPRLVSSLDIADPFQQNWDEAKAIFQRIEHLVDLLAQQLTVTGGTCRLSSQRKSGQ